MPFPSDHFKHWLKRQMSFISEEGQIEKFVLFHVLDGGEGKEQLDVFPIESGRNLDEFAQEIFEAARHDTESRMTQTIQQYIVAGFLPEQEEPHCQHPIIIRPLRNYREEPTDTEPANEKGIVSQLMRHNEALAKNLQFVTESTYVRVARELEMERNRNKALEDQRIANFEKMQELLDRQIERDIAASREMAQSKRQESLMNMAVSLMPLLVSKFIGGNVPGASKGSLAASSARDMAIKNLLSGLSQEEMIGITSSLTPENQMMLLEVMKDYQGLEEKEKEQTNGKN